MSFAVIVSVADVFQGVRKRRRRRRRGLIIWTGRRQGKGALVTADVGDDGDNTA